jgi:PEP-CTERM motif
MNRHYLCAMAAASLTAAATLSQAAVVDFHGWEYRNSRRKLVDVTAVNDTRASSHGAAGALEGTVIFNGDEDGFSGRINGFVSYGVELTESLTLPSGIMTHYRVVDGGTYLEWADANGNGKTAQQTSDRIGQLVDYANSNDLIRNAAESTALQLAIWNIIYDTDNSVVGGIFSDRSGRLFDRFADRLLADSLVWGMALDVYVLTKDGSQDFLLTGATSHPVSTPPVSGVPEPATLGLVGLALAAAGVASRRRSAA